MVGCLRLFCRLEPVDEIAERERGIIMTASGDDKILDVDKRGKTIPGVHHAII